MKDHRVCEDPDWDFWSLYDTGQWEPETKAVVDRFVQPGTLAIDIGAWIGPVTLWMLARGARVLAFEPDIEAARMFRINTRGLRGRVQLATIALSDTNGSGYLVNPTRFGDSQSQLRVGRVPENSRAVIRRNPAWLFTEFDTASLIKLDIEGHETRVLPTLLPLARARNIPVYLSWHEPWWETPVPESIRTSWFSGFSLEPIRGDGWTGFSELLAVPQ